MRERSRRVSPPLLAPEDDPEVYPDAWRTTEGSPLRARVDWDAIFGRHAPLALEIGTGNGAFMLAESGQHPETNFVGIERSREFFLKFKKLMVREGRTNVRCVCADAEEVLPPLFENSSLETVICLFSDPWPKRRHRDRRVFRTDFMEEIERVVRPGGTLRFKTDVGWYFNLTVHLVRRRAQWKMLDAGPCLENNPEGDSGSHPPTNFERKARIVGREIWGFVAVRT